MKRLSLHSRPQDEGERLDRFIARAGGIARLEARRILERGGVWVDGKRVKIASRPVRDGQEITVVVQEAGRPEPRDLVLGPERILFEDAHLIAVDKPAFVPAQATLASDRGTLLSLVSEHVGRPVGLVHRLDLETSGVTVFGKTRAATSALAAAFREGTAHKRYLAVVSGALPEEGRTDLPVGPDPSRKGRFLAQAGRGLPAATRFRVLARVGSLMAVEAFPETGRTHQIRVHLKSLGAPVVGDDLYGGPEQVDLAGQTLRAERVLLHAQSLELPHPATGAPLRLEAPVPADLAAFLTALGAPSGAAAR